MQRSNNTLEIYIVTCKGSEQCDVLIIRRSSPDHLDSFFRTLLVISGLLFFFLASTELEAKTRRHKATRQGRQPEGAILEMIEIT